jgi:hypothetical protein
VKRDIIPCPFKISKIKAINKPTTISIISSKAFTQELKKYTFPRKRYALLSVNNTKGIITKNTIVENIYKFVFHKG